MIVIFQIIVLIFSVIVHEIAHGFIALRLGDRTAKDLGRLTLNPIKHIDLFGSILFPLALSIFKLPIIGWAKPVPFDPRNLKNPKRDSGLIAAAGPLTNIFVALVFGLLVRSLELFMITPTVIAIALMFNYICIINISLAIFNLVPIPPLDGSGILFSLLPRSFQPFEEAFIRYGFYILIVFVAYGINLISPVIMKLHVLFTGSGGFLGI
jgi:Zn-dependent protease